jgi:hypothetical protein
MENHRQGTLGTENHNPRSIRIENHRQPEEPWRIIDWRKVGQKSQSPVWNEYTVFSATWTLFV